jgi:RNA polymerase sigma-70 factor, ECF subfamily
MEALQSSIAVRAALDEAGLAQRASAGDQAAFVQIMRAHNQRLFRLAIGIIGEPAEAEDVLQESYVRAFYALDSYGGRGSLGAWLARIVRNEAIDRLRARNSRRNHIAIESELETAREEDAGPVTDFNSSTDMDPQALAQAADVKHLLEHAIQRLPETFRTAFVMREVEGLSVDETAEYLEIPAATVKTRTFRARTLLRSYLREDIRNAVPQTFTFLSVRCDRLVAGVLRRLKM